MKINVLSLFSGVGGIKMGFSLEKKKPTDVPMHRAEAPMELWNKHKSILKDHQHIYTDFTWRCQVPVPCHLFCRSKSTFIGQYLIAKVRKKLERNAL